MPPIYRTYFLFVALLLLFSCNIEKRQYRSGYYISSPGTVKTKLSEKKDTDLLSDFRSDDENEKRTSKAQATITSSPTLSILPAYSFDTKTPHFPKSIKSVSPLEEDFKKNSKIQSRFRPIASDNEKIKKDVKDLLISSIVAFFLALLYGIFSISGIASLTNLIFILTPFAIIGIWIFALLLYTKYATDDQYNGAEQKPNEDRIITKKKAFLLAGLLGIFGAHRFYLGYTKMGILEMFTLGGFFVLYFIDLIRIKTGKLKPVKGNYDPEGITYNKPKKNKTPNKSQKLIKISLLISVVALMIILGFAIFF